MAHRNARLTLHARTVLVQRVLSGRLVAHVAAELGVKKLGRLREGGGWRVHGRDSDAHRAGRNAHGVGFDFVHAAIDDHSRLAYAEIHTNECPETCAGFLHRATVFFAEHGHHPHRAGGPTTP